MKTIKGGYFGRLLRVNLDDHTFKSEEIPEKILLDYIGGRGLGSKILFDEVPGKTDALGPENKLIFATGPLTGINAPTTSRYAIVSKSPLTGTVGGCSSGGHFGVDLKSTGYDVLIMDGHLDAHFINTLEQKLDKTRFSRVDADIVEKLIQKEAVAARTTASHY